MTKKRKIKNDPNIGVTNGKFPRSHENPESYFQLSPSWCFSKFDFENSKWSLKAVNIHDDILPKLVDFERRNWSNIVSDKKHNHWIKCSSFIKEAQNRLIELQLYYDELFSLRLTGTMRLFGYIENGVYYIIWCDLHHEICPAPKKHS